MLISADLSVLSTSTKLMDVQGLDYLRSLFNGDPGNEATPRNFQLKD